MKWYLAKLVFRVVCTNGDHQPQFEEQVRLISAEDNLHAFYKARKIGDTDHFGGIKGIVKWKFIDVSDLQCIGEFLDGIEISSATTEYTGSAEEYILQVKRASSAIMQSGLHQFIDLN